MQFQISSRRENRQRDIRVIKFKEKFSTNNFALSDGEDNTSGSLNRGGIADLPLLRTLLDEDHPNQYENSHKLCNEMGHPVVN